MKKFRVEITKVENNYCFEEEWDSDTFQDDIIANSPGEAILLAKDYLDENGANSADYIFRAKENKNI